MINPTGDPKIYEINKQIMSKSQQLDFKDLKLNVEIVVRKGGAKSTLESEKVLGQTTIELSSILSQSDDNYKGKIPIFLVSSENRETKSTYKQMSNLVKIKVNQILGYLNFEAETQKHEVISNSQNSKLVTFNLKISEIKGYSFGQNYLVIEISGIEAESSSKVLEIIDFDSNKISVNFEQRFLISCSSFVSQNKKFAVVKLIEREMGTKEQKLIGYSKVSLGSLNNVLCEGKVSEEYQVIDSGVFELISVQNVIKGFLNIELSVGKKLMHKNSEFGQQNIGNFGKISAPKSLNEELKIESHGDNVFNKNYDKDLQRKKPNEMEHDYPENLNEMKTSEIHQEMDPNIDHNYYPNLQNRITQSEFKPKFEPANNHQNYKLDYKSQIKESQSQDFMSAKTIIDSLNPMNDDNFESEQNLLIRSEAKSSNSEMQISINKTEYKSKNEQINFGFETFNKNQLSNFDLFSQKHSQFYNFQNLNLLKNDSTNLQILILFFDFCVSKKDDLIFSKNVDEFSKLKQIKNAQFYVFLKQNDFPFSEKQIDSLINVLNYTQEDVIDTHELLHSVRNYCNLKSNILVHFFRDLFAFVQQIQSSNFQKTITLLISQRTDQNAFINYAEFENIFRNLKIECSEERMSDFKLLGYFNEAKMIFLPNVLNFMVLTHGAFPLPNKPNEHKNGSVVFSQIYESCSSHVIAMFNFETFVEIESVIFLQEICNQNFVENLKQMETNNNLKIEQFLTFLKSESGQPFGVCIFDVFLIFYKIFQFKNQSCQINKNSCMFLETVSEFIAINHRTNTEMEDLNYLMHSKVIEIPETEECRTIRSSHCGIPIKEPEEKIMNTQFQTNNIDNKSTKDDKLIDQKVNNSESKRLEKSNINCKNMHMEFPKSNDPIKMVSKNDIKTGSDSNQINSQTHHLIIRIAKINLSNLPDHFLNKYFYLEFKVSDFDELFESKIYSFADAKSSINPNMEIRLQLPDTHSYLLQHENRAINCSPQLNYIKANFVTLSKEDQGQTFSQCIFQIDIRNFSTELTSVIVPDFGHFSKNNIEFTSSDLGTIKYHAYFETIEVKNKLQLNQKQFSFKKEIPKSGFLSFLIQRFDFEENFPNVIDNFPNRFLNNFDFVKIEFKLTIRLPKNEKLSKSFYAKTFDKKNDFLAFFLKIKNQNEKINPFLLKILIDLKENELSSFCEDFFSLNLACFFYDRFDLKIYECEISSGMFQISEVFSNCNNNGVELCVHCNRGNKVSVLMNVNFLEKDVFNVANDDEDDTSAVYVNIQPVGFVGFIEDEVQQNCCLRVISVNDETKNEEFIQLRELKVLNNIGFKEWEDQDFTHQFLMKISNIKHKFVFQMYQNSKTCENIIASSHEFCLKKLVSSTNATNITFQSIKIGSNIFVCKIVICEISKINNPNNHKIGQKIIDVLSSKTMSNFARFSNQFSSKMTHLNSLKKKNQHKTKNLIQANRFEKRITISENEFIDFLKSSFDFVKSEINQFMSQFNRFPDDFVDISNLFPNEFEKYSCCLNREQKTCSFLEDLIKEFLYQDEPKSGDIETGLFNDILQKFDILIDEHEVIKYSQILGMTSTAKLSYLSFFYKLMVESNCLNSHNAKKKDELKMSEQIFVESKREVANLKSYKRSNDNLIFKSLKNIEISISSVSFINLNTLTAEKTTPNSFIALRLFNSSKFDAIKSKFQPRNSNPIFKNVHKLSPLEVQSIETKIDEPNFVDLFFRKFTSNLNDTIQDEKMLTFDFTFDELFGQEVFLKGFSDTSNVKAELVKTSHNCQMRIEFTFKPTTQKAIDYLESKCKEDDDEIAHTLLTLKELSNTKNEDQNQDNIFDFIIQNVQKNNNNKPVECKEPSNIMDRLQYLEKTNAKDKFESFGDIQSNYSNGKLKHNIIKTKPVANSEAKNYEGIFEKFENGIGKNNLSNFVKADFGKYEIVKIGTYEDVNLNQQKIDFKNTANVDNGIQKNQIDEFPKYFSENIKHDKQTILTNSNDWKQLSCKNDPIFNSSYLQRNCELNQIVFDSIEEEINAKKHLILNSFSHPLHNNHVTNQSSKSPVDGVTAHHQFESNIGDGHVTNKSNPFAQCIGDDLDSAKNQTISDNLEQRKVIDFSIKKEGNQSPFSKLNSSDASLRLMRKIPKEMFSESELKKINRLVNTKKIDPNLFEFESDDDAN